MVSLSFYSRINCKIVYPKDQLTLSYRKKAETIQIHLTYTTELCNENKKFIVKDIIRRKEKRPIEHVYTHTDYFSHLYSIHAYQYKYCARNFCCLNIYFSLHHSVQCRHKCYATFSRTCNWFTFGTGWNEVRSHSYWIQIGFYFLKFFFFHFCFSSFLISIRFVRLLLVDLVLGFNFELKVLRTFCY